MNIIDLYHANKLQAFKEALFTAAKAKRLASGNNAAASTSTAGSSLSRSPNGASYMLGGTVNAASAVVNRRDMQGRTVLHWVAAKTDERSLEYLYALLDCPTVNINLQDVESGWTALHRYGFSFFCQMLAN